MHLNITSINGAILPILVISPIYAPNFQLSGCVKIIWDNSENIPFISVQDDKDTLSFFYLWKMKIFFVVVFLQ